MDPGGQMQRCIHHGIAVDDVQPLAIAQIVRFFLKEWDSFFVQFQMFFWRDFCFGKR